MSKRLEEYIKTHRKAFDLDEPSDALWSKIEAGLGKEQSKKSFRQPFWLAAAASVFIVAGLLFIFIYPKKRESVEVADISPLISKKEMRFVTLIDQKRDSLMSFAKDNPDLYHRFSNDLEKLGRDYEQLKKELPNSPNQKLVVKAMVRNLEIQLHIINQQLSIFNEVDQIKKENKI